MSLRFPLVATVVGALVIGGATTGTTLARWHDEQALPASSVTSGSVALTIGGAVNASLGSLPELALNQGSTPGAAQRLTTTVVNEGAGKNLRMTVRLLDVTASSSALSDGLEVAVGSAATEADCPSSPASAYEAVSATNAVSLTPTALAPGDSRALCLHVRVEGGAGTAVQDADGELSLSLVGEQVRP